MGFHFSKTEFLYCGILKGHIPDHDRLNSQSHHPYSHLMGYSGCKRGGCFFICSDFSRWKKLHHYSEFSRQAPPWQGFVKVGFWWWVTTIQQIHRSSCTLIIFTTGFVIGFMPRAHFARWNITSTTDTIHCRGPAALAIEIIAIFIIIIIQDFIGFKIPHHWNKHLSFFEPIHKLNVWKWNKKHDFE